MSLRQFLLKRDHGTGVARAEPPDDGTNVAGNERITGSLGAALFALLFVEGLTILGVSGHMSWHVFVGVLIVPFAAAKLGSTTYRFVRYYTGNPAYVRKGPPPLLLRLLGPFVSLLTVGVLATGVAAVLDRQSGALSFLHKAVFVLWFGAMTLHVLGHVLETPALAFADWRRTRRRAVRGAPARLALLGVVAVVALPLAFASLQWAHHWQRAGDDGPATRARAPHVVRGDSAPRSG
jgi:uncharacterized membrane protein